MAGSMITGKIVYFRIQVMIHTIFATSKTWTSILDTKFVHIGKQLWQ